MSTFDLLSKNDKEIRNWFVVKIWEIRNWFAVKNSEMRSSLLFFANFPGRFMRNCDIVFDLKSLIFNQF